MRLDAYAGEPNVLHEAVAPGSRQVRPCAFGWEEEAAAYPGRLPTDIASAVTAQDLGQQLQAVQRIETALAASKFGRRGRDSISRPSGQKSCTITAIPLRRAVISKHVNQCEMDPFQ